jgi:hypothetical protein
MIESFKLPGLRLSQMGVDFSKLFGIKNLLKLIAVKIGNRIKPFNQRFVADLIFMAKLFFAFGHSLFIRI